MTHPLPTAHHSCARLTVGLDLDGTVPGGTVTITITGPAAVWFGVAFGATEMEQKPGAFIVDGAAT